jgi:uncharacterized protein YecE (DUF72 family)
MKLFVGQSELRGDFARYCRRFPLVEVRTGAGKTPRRKRLTAWRESAPEGFVFSVVLPPAVAELSDNSDDELKAALLAADELDAKWLVLRTPASVRPDTRVRARLQELLGLLSRTRRVAWEPAGLWEDDVADKLGAEAGAVVSRDVSRDPPPDGPLVYSRLRTLGHGGRLALGTADRVIEHVYDRDEIYLIVDGGGGLALVRELGELLGIAGAGNEPDSEDEEPTYEEMS